MNWKDEAVDKLRRYRAMRASMETIPLELARLETQACAIRGASADKTPVRGGGNYREQVMLNNLVHRQELAWSLEQARYWVQSVDLGLEALSGEERMILDRMYIRTDSGALSELCRELQTEQSSVYRRRDNALRKFTLAMYGAMES